PCGERAHGPERRVVHERVLVERGRDELDVVTVEPTRVAGETGTDLVLVGEQPESRQIGRGQLHRLTPSTRPPQGTGRPAAAGPPQAPRAPRRPTRGARRSRPVR